MSYPEACAICGKELVESNFDPVFGITLGHISQDCEGFMADTDEPWESILCPDCHNRIQEFISLLPPDSKPFDDECLECGSSDLNYGEIESVGNVSEYVEDVVCSECGYRFEVYCTQQRSVLT